MFAIVAEGSRRRTTRMLSNLFDTFEDAEKRLKVCREQHYHTYDRLWIVELIPYDYNCYNFEIHDYQSTSVHNGKPTGIDNAFKFDFPCR